MLSRLMVVLHLCLSIERKILQRAILNHNSKSPSHVLQSLSICMVIEMNRLQSTDSQESIQTSLQYVVCSMNCHTLQKLPRCTQTITRQQFISFPWRPPHLVWPWPSSPVCREDEHRYEPCAIAHIDYPPS